jgi:hypothetical protein
MVMERQQPPRFSQRAAENLSVRRFHSSDNCTAVGKPATATVEDSASLKLDRIIRSLDEQIIMWKEIVELQEEDILRRRGRKVLAGTVVAGGLAAYYVKRRFFGGAKEEEDKEI